MRSGTVRVTVAAMAVFATLLAARGAVAQDDSRAANRESMRALLNQVGPRIGVEFRQSERNPWNFVGSMTTGLRNAESLEILALIGRDDVIWIQVYPHRAGGGYFNLSRAANQAAFMRKLLSWNDTGFFYWGADDVDDVFAAYTFTLESGFPSEAVSIVLRSISLLDKKVGDLVAMSRQ